MGPSDWAHHNPVRIVGGTLDDLSRHLPNCRHVLLVTSLGFTRRGVTAKVRSLFADRQVTIYDKVRPNPDLDALDSATAAYGSLKIDGVVGLGGGSALDAAKVLAVTLHDPLPKPLDHVLRQGKPHAWAGRLPLAAVPTTAGTGAEVTPFATVWDHLARNKYSLAGPQVYPDVALLDAALTLSLPPAETLYPGLDATSHALESLWNRNRTPVSSALAMRALALIVEALPGVLEKPEDLGLRRRMQEASVLAGLAISQTRTALAHAISYPLTTHFGVTHGLACSFTLPALLRLNLPFLAKNGCDEKVLLATLAVLERFALAKRLAELVPAGAVVGLKDFMTNKDRSGNYAGLLPDGLDGLLQRALLQA